MDDRSPPAERNSVISDSSSSSSNDTMKIRGSLPNMQSEEQVDSPSTPSIRSSVMLLGKLSAVMVLGNFRSEYEYDYEYEFSVLNTRTLKNVDLET